MLATTKRQFHHVPPHSVAYRGYYTVRRWVPFQLDGACVSTRCCNHDEGEVHPAICDSCHPPASVAPFSRSVVRCIKFTECDCGCSYSRTVVFGVSLLEDNLMLTSQLSWRYAISPDSFFFVNDWRTTQRVHGGDHVRDVRCAGLVHRRAGRPCPRRFLERKGGENVVPGLAWHLSLPHLCRKVGFLAF